ncbi:hypothetical protein [Flavobacterium sp.]|uniref:hypothetical protein n=1 Tax=Flavobacterium sp. TaxID=239 RepID=UPI00375193A8
MANKEIIIKVGNDRIFLNPGLSIPIQQTNIPKKYLTFRSHEDIFWKVELLGYKEDIECLKVSVKDYRLTSITGFDQQEPTKKVTKLFFDKFNWIKLEPLLTYYHKKELKDYLYSSTARSDQQIHPDFHTSYEQHEAKPYIETINESFGVYFSDCNFMLGYVTFKKYIKKIEKEVEFKISNEHILAEFDNIKFWFAKKLNVKKFKVFVSITITDNEVTETRATSEHIKQITPELIDSVKYQRTFALTKEPKLSQPDKSLFTSEEIFSQMNSEDIEGNVFKQSENDILNFFLTEKDIRNRKQLTYLAGKKQSKNYKLRYTLNPNFGFLFLIEGEENNHFVWELLNSNATYIWSIEKGKQNVELQFKRIESIVNNVRTSGRENYKRAYRNNHQDNDLVFRVLNHKNIGSKLVDDFPDWKSRLNEQLT